MTGNFPTACFPHLRAGNSCFVYVLCLHASYPLTISFTVSSLSSLLALSPCEFAFVHCVSVSMCVRACARACVCLCVCVCVCVCKVVMGNYLTECVSPGW